MGYDGFGYECRSCKTHTSVKKLDSNIPCPKCGSLLTPVPISRHWIFQFNPRIYRWSDRMNDTKGNKPERWLASQDSEYMKKDDFVAVWASGKNAGIYALGQMITPAEDKALEIDDLKYWKNEQAANKFLYNRSVLVQYSTSLPANPVLELECLEDEVLRNLSILDHPQATNFQITFNDWQRIVELVSKKT